MASASFTPAPVLPQPQGKVDLTLTEDEAYHLKALLGSCHYKGVLFPIFEVLSDTLPRNRCSNGGIMGTIDDTAWVIKPM